MKGTFEFSSEGPHFKGTFTILGNWRKKKISPFNRVSRGRRFYSKTLGVKFLRGTFPEKNQNRLGIQKAIQNKHLRNRKPTVP